LGFYADDENEHHTVYAVDSNDLFNRYGTSEQATVADITTAAEAPENEETGPANTGDAA